MNLLAELQTAMLFADSGYVTNEIIEFVENQGMTAIIPLKKIRKIQRKYDNNLYKKRHLVENAFLHLKRMRGITTRYAKNTKAFRVAVILTSIKILLRLFCVDSM